MARVDTEAMEKLGGRMAFYDIVDYFYAKILLDLDLKHYFKNANMKELREHQVSMLVSTIDSNDKYRGKPMELAHKGLGITKNDFSKVAGYLKEALESVKMSSDIIDFIMSEVTSLTDNIIGK